MACYEFEGARPVVHPSSFIHPLAAVIGQVSVGRNVYVGPGATLRGDFGAIVIGDGCNVQESCTIHMFPGVTVRLEENAHIGHGAIIHGAVIRADVLIGMNAVIMDNAEVGEGCVVGALTFVPGEMKIPPRKVVVGNPAKVIKDVSEEMFAWKREGTALYQGLPGRLLANLKECEPLTEGAPRDKSTREPGEVDYAPWRGKK